MTAEAKPDLFRFKPDIIPQDIERQLVGQNATQSVEVHESLTVVRKKTVVNLRGILNNRQIIADDAQVEHQLTGNILLQRFKRTELGSGRRKDYIVWDIRAENTAPIVCVGVTEDKNHKLSGEVFVGFLTDTPTTVRGVSYDIKDGKRKKEYWEREIGLEPVCHTNPAYDFWHSETETGSIILHGEVWRDDETEIERFKFPDTLDISNSLGEIRDDKGEIVTDPTLPWQQWFRRWSILSEVIAEK